MKRGYRDAQAQRPPLILYRRVPPASQQAPKGDATSACCKAVAAEETLSLSNQCVLLPWTRWPRTAQAREACNEARDDDSAAVSQLGRTAPHETLPLLVSRAACAKLWVMQSTSFG
jgi:hypothetical protein